jgi:hypothetical protein
MATLTPEEKFGIRYRNPGARSSDQKYSMFVGIVAIVLGIIGFIQTGFTNYAEMSDHYIFGLFQTNGFHNTMFIIVGLFWLMGAFTLTPAGNQGLNIALGIILLIFAVLGFMGYWNLLSVAGGLNGNNILDLVLAFTTLFIGGGLLSGDASE